MKQDRPNRYGQWATGAVADQIAKADLVVLWDLQEADHAEAFLQGLCTVTFAEHSSRLRTAVERLTGQGVNVQTVQATSADIISVLQRHSLSKDSGGVAAAIAMIYQTNRDSKSLDLAR